jgi:hypothetical protein
VNTKKSPTGKSAKNSDWLVYRLVGPKATLLGHVTAPNRETAPAVAYDEFAIISPAERQRIIVQQMGKA